MGSCYSVKETEQLHIETLTTEQVKNGPFACICIPPLRKVTKRTATLLTEKQFIHIENIRDGSMKVIRGPGLIFLNPFERLTNEGVQNSVALKPDEYIKLYNKKSGEIRVERGETLVWLEPFDEIMGSGVQKVIVVDTTKACLVRDIITGTQHLIVEPQMFVPSKTQEVLEARDLQILKEYEVMVLTDPKGRFVFKHGWIPEESSFFVPPYHKVLSLRWTKTSVRKALAGKFENLNLTVAEGARVDTVLDEQKFDRIDVRHRFMSYAFVVRTHDNVEIILDIVIGWEITNVEKMINKTKDTTNDICLTVRSEIIEKVAKQAFRKFMQEVNAVVENAVLQSDESFYKERGIHVSSIQVEGFSCKHDQTEKVLQETVQETTNKMNRVLKQETVNEVIRVEMEGKIREEELKKRVLEIQYEHEQLIARTAGEAAAKRVQSFISCLPSEIPLEHKLMVFNLLEKKDCIHDLATGTGITLFCTPQDMNLNMAAFGNMDGVPNVLTAKVSKVSNQS